MHPLTHPGSSGLCIAANAPLKSIVASSFHRFPRLAERPPGEGFWLYIGRAAGCGKQKEVPACCAACVKYYCACSTCCTSQIKVSAVAVAFLLPIASPCRQSLCLYVVFLRCYLVSGSFQLRAPLHPVT